MVSHKYSQTCWPSLNPNMMAYSGMPIKGAMFPAIKDKITHLFLNENVGSGIKQCLDCPSPLPSPCVQDSLEGKRSFLSHPNPSTNHGDMNDFYLHKPTWHVLKHFPFPILFFSTSA